MSVSSWESIYSFRSLRLSSRIWERLGFAMTLGHFFYSNISFFNLIQDA